MQELINSAESDADEATTASSDAIGTSRVLLLVIAGISVVIGLSIIVGFVSRLLLRRLNQLSNRMRRMADGDLEDEVIISGRDEVSEMAHALEIFRRHALEVQRLNLVEKLAEELGEKNNELEQVLDELHRAQDQIVMREKLAALGEVTAGVAHEIRNPAQLREELLGGLRRIGRGAPGGAGGGRGHLDHRAAGTHSATSPPTSPRTSSASARTAPAPTPSCTTC